MAAVICGCFSFLIDSYAFADEADPPALTFRARTITLAPTQHAMIHWRYGGESLGGDVTEGVVTQEKPAPPDALGSGDDALGLKSLVEGGPKDRTIVPGETFDTHYLASGVWSRSQPLRELRSRFITFMITGHETGTTLRDCVLEIEVSHQGQVIKTFRVAGPDGPTFGVVIPWNELDGDEQPTPSFIDGLGGQYEYSSQKVALLKDKHWIDWPTPRRVGVVSTCGGYGQGQGRGIRTTHWPTMAAELEVMRLMGLNGIRSTVEVMEQVASGEGVGKPFTHARLFHAQGGRPIPTTGWSGSRGPLRDVGDGCPYLPRNAAAIPDKARATMEALRQEAVESGVDHAWVWTIDEIGNVYNSSNERKEHPGSCPHCSEAFRQMIRDDGRSLEDFNAASWDQIRPLRGYWAYDYWESHRILSQRVADAKQAMNQAAASLSTGETSGLEALTLEEKKPEVDYAAELMKARERLEDLEWNSTLVYVPENERQASLDEAGWHLLDYYTHRFMSRTSGVMFTPLRDMVRAENQRKRAAIGPGRGDALEAQQPWLYLYALRQPRFTWGGGSLGMFDYYRHADTAMVYETSNRDARVYQWDSFMNDVGLSLQKHMGLDFGVYVKPHRGAPIQRGLSAAARNATLIYWYTYGPEWVKGDSFGGDADRREQVAFANRLIAAIEPFQGVDALTPAEVAIVRPRTAEFFSGDASWENGKWLYMALAHSHIPVEAVDEFHIEASDLSQYKAIVICGSHIRRKSAERLKQWVAEGGTLYTSGHGVAKDEAGRPLTLLHEVFGVEDRVAEFEQWGQVQRYGATSLPPIKQTATPPGDSTVTGRQLLSGSYQPQVGYELLRPTSDATVLASNASGKPVAISHSFGKGRAYLVGTFAGLEYAVEPMGRMAYEDAKRNWIVGPLREAGVKPVVEVSDPLVEAVLLRRENGDRCLALMNWHWDPDQALLRDLQLKVRFGGRLARASSVALQQQLAGEQEDGWLIIDLPSLGAADVLLLDSEAGR